mmetsp:Transcript_24248/g.21528  ORF Transcript_24248/g.21528 Transcript_24248/m.21528 type:complete len:108 (-) Transcript_24248:23-346(-)
MGNCPKDRLDIITAKTIRTMKDLDSVLNKSSPFPFYTLNTKTIGDLQVFEEIHFLHELSDIKVDNYKNIAEWYWKMFENPIIQHYHRLMVDQVNIDFDNNEIEFTNV